MKVLVLIRSDIPEVRNYSLYQRCKTFLASGKATILVCKGRRIPKEFRQNPSLIVSRSRRLHAYILEAIKLLRSGEFQAIYTRESAFALFLPIIKGLFRSRIVCCLESQHSPYYFRDVAAYKGKLFWKLGARLFLICAAWVYRLYDLHVVLAYKKDHGLAALLRNKFGVRASCIIALPNGVDLKFLERFRGRRVQGLKEGEFRIGYVGTIQPGKAYEIVKMVPMILKRIPDAKILLAGPLRGVKRKEIECRGIRYLGVLEHSQALEALVNCHVCIYIGTARFHDNRTAYPCKIFEYMALAKPVVAPRFAGIEIMVGEEGDGWLYPPDQPNLAVEMLVLLRKDVRLRKWIGEKMHENVAKFDWVDLNRSFEEELWSRIEDAIKPYKSMAYLNL
jgi:glycosyltransferase involved in cell wall biosynthesis